MGVVQTSTISFKVAPGFKKKLEKLADREFRSTSGFIKNALRYYLDNRNEVGTFTPNKKEIKMLRQAEKEIKAGLTKKLDPYNMEKLFE